MSPLTSAALVVMGVGLLAWLLRRTSGSEGIDKALLSGREPGPGSAKSSVAEPETEPEAADDTEEWMEGELALQELLAITSTGEVFLPYDGRVHVLPLGDARERIAAGVTSRENVRQEVVDALRIAEGTGRLSTQFSPGDFTAGRVRRGAPSSEPWQLELLGRDGEYIAFVFETEEAARSALAMLERCGTIHRPVDEGGEPVPASAEDFEEARRRYDETVAELATMPEEDEEETPGSPRDERPPQERAAESSGESSAESSAETSSEPTGESAAEHGAGSFAEPGAEPATAAASAGERAAELDYGPDLPPREGQDWLIEQLGRLIQRVGLDAFLCAPLITPSDEFFPDPWTADADSVRMQADRLLGYAGLQGYNAGVRLIGQPEAAPGRPRAEEDTGGASGRMALARFAGVFGSTCRLEITLSALSLPDVLVEALAHEISHAWRSARGLVEPDSRLEESLTDLTTVYLGLGLLTANAAYRYRSWAEYPGSSATRWSHAQIGYLSPQAMCFLLAIQAVVREIPCERVEHWLETAQAGYFTAATKQIEHQRDDLIRRLGLPPEESWPEPWNTPAGRE